MRCNPFHTRRAQGGAISPHAPDGDSVLAVLSPGYVSYDAGETWREYPGDVEEGTEEFIEARPDDTARCKTCASMECSRVEGCPDCGYCDACGLCHHDPCSREDVV